MTQLGEAREFVVEVAVVSGVVVGIAVVAVSVVIEHGGSGSKIAAPIAKKIFSKVLS